LKSALDQVKQSIKPGTISITPIRYDNNIQISIAYQNPKKDFQVFINKKDGGTIGFQKTWEW
jgi:hypothetical protein